MHKLTYPDGATYCIESKNKREYFYPDGTPKTIEMYAEGKLHGPIHLYWPNGQLKRRLHFHFGVREGLDQMWSEEGVLVDEGAYHQGKPVGKHRRWNQRGGLIEEMDFLEQGRFNLRRWDDEGELRVEALWEEENYRERAWDRFEKKWVEKKGYWNGTKLVYL